VARARRWAGRRAGSKRRWLMVRLAPHAGMVGLAVVFPAIAGFLFGGRDVTWLSAVYGWVALVVLVVAAAAASAGTLIARSVHVARLQRAPDGDRGEVSRRGAPDPLRLG
jgi:hypothetical protein